MRRRPSWLALVAGLLLAGGLAAAERSFRMGFTPFPWDATAEALDDTYARLEAHSDIIAHHFDNGVPWPEALSGDDYPPLVENEIRSRLERTPAGHPVYLAVTPIATLRDGLADYWGNAGPQEPPPPWDRRGFGSRQVRKAFVRHCLRMIERFQPDFFAYGVEVDLLAINDPEAFEDFVKLARRVYRKLDRKHPDLPIFLTFTLGQPFDFERRREVMERLLPWSDLLAVSTYPYLAAGIEGDPRRIPDDWFTRLEEVADGKPIAVAETGYAAETLTFETLDWTIPGREAWQKRYVKRLLSDADRIEAEFVIWFVLVDYDRLWLLMEEAGALELFKAWRDTGLFDESLEARPALRPWDRWLERRHTPPR